MKWYVVTKRIHGRNYLYWQRTQRIGGEVKTFNKYIGPGANPPRMRSLAAQMENLPEAHKNLRTEYDAGNMTKTAYLEAITTPTRYVLWEKKDDEDYFPGQTFTEDEAAEQLRTVYNYDAQDEGVNLDKMGIEELMNEDWELRPIQTNNKSPADPTATTIAISTDSILSEYDPPDEAEIRVIQEMASQLRKGAKFPPIILNQNMEVIDGYHRLEAHRLAGIEHINAIVKREEEQ